MARFTGAISESGIPQLAKFITAYNEHYIDETWNGKHVYFAPSDYSWDAVWIPTDYSLNLPVGFAFTIVTDDSVNVYISPVDTEVTYMYAVSVPYAPYGYDIPSNTMVTVLKVDTDRWIISGYGVQQD
jgi:hypothetical protein